MGPDTGQSDLESRLRRLATLAARPRHKTAILAAADAIAEIAAENEDFKRRLEMIEPFVDHTPAPIDWEVKSSAWSPKVEAEEERRRAESQ